MRSLLYAFPMTQTALRYRALLPNDVDDYRALRLSAMLAEPDSFRTSHAEEAAQPLIRLQQRLLHTAHQRIFGAWAGSELVGIVGLKREPIAVTHEHALIWGLYVEPAARRGGVARGLMDAALRHARGIDELRRVTLCVHRDNAAAQSLYRQLGFRLMAEGTEPQEELHMLLLLQDEH